MTEYTIPAWRDTYFTTGASPYEYYIVADGTDVFHGKVWKSPNEAETKVNVTKIIRDWLANQLPDFRNIADVVEKHERAYRTFDLCEVGGDVVARYNVLFDFDGEWNGEYKVLTEPIDGHLDPRMKFLWSIYSPTDIDIYMSPYYFSLLNNPVTIGSFSGDTAIIRWDTNYMQAVITCTPDNWLEVTDISLTGATLHVKVDNETLSSHTGSVAIYIDGDYETSLTVVQEGKYFNLIDNEIIFNYVGGTENVRWSTNISLNALSAITSDPDFTVSNVTRSGCSVTATAIPEDEPRGGTIYVYSGNTLLNTISITQGDYGNKYFTLQARTKGNITWQWAVDGSYRVKQNGTTGDWIYQSDSGVTWTSCESGDTVEFKSSGDITAGENPILRVFGGRGGSNLNAYGNILSLYYGDAFRGRTSIPQNINGTCSYMFSGNTCIINIENIVFPSGLAGRSEVFKGMFYKCKYIQSKSPKLPATTLSPSCYSQMFYGCNFLATAPALPATTLAPSCYYYMFCECNKIPNAPALPATTLEPSCYAGMFMDCTSLKTAPTLPATTLAPYCYTNMFARCLTLTTASALPATTLETACYYGMYAGCTQLVNAPSELPGTTLTGSCYYDMFSGCTSLTTAPTIMATSDGETSGAYCFGMFANCTSLVNVQPVLALNKVGSYGYYKMFAGCTSLVTPPELPAMILCDECCYAGMFSGCTSLTTAPVLPATTLASRCYSSMFEGCTSLTATPALLATGTTDACYSHMFAGCTSLTSVPSVLPAAKVAWLAYYCMFMNCTSLVTAPELPATDLLDGTDCYARMFEGCTSLVTPPPILPASAVTAGGTQDYTEGSYYRMFAGCTSLATAPEMSITCCYPAAGTMYEMFSGCTSLTESPVIQQAAPISHSYGTYSMVRMFDGCTNLTKVTCLLSPNTGVKTDWLRNVGADGTFVKRADTTWSRGDSRVPTSWTIVDYTP